MLDQRSLESTSTLDRILFISPTDVMSPLLHSQGLPHIRELSRQGYSFCLLTFERSDWTTDEKHTAEELRLRLESWGVEWSIARNRESKLVPNSVLNIIFGCVSAYLILREKKIRIVHCRSYVPAYMCLILRMATPLEFIFDMRGFLPDEYVENGYLTKTSLVYRVSKWLERKCLRKAASVVVTCRDMQESLLTSRSNAVFNAELQNKLSLIPNAVDTSRFNSPDRDLKRKQFGLTDERVLCWLVGGITRFHMPEEVISFFKAWKSVSRNVKLLLLTKTQDAAELLSANGLSADESIIASPSPADVPAFVAMADAGIHFSLPGHPGHAVKLGEYLASGLPLIISSTVENSEHLVLENSTGVVVDGFETRDYVRASEQLENLLMDAESMRVRCRHVAEAQLGLANAVGRYSAIYGKLSSTGKSASG